MKPSPVRYCPMQDREALPMDVVLSVPMQESYGLAKVVRRCLCMTMAAAELECDPLVCTPKLIAGLQWARSTDNVKPTACGVSKRIYREYARDVKETLPEWDKFLLEFE